MARIVWRDSAACRPSSWRSRLARSGATISAAAVGVGARRSAAKSAMVKSVSWPTPLITGMVQARMARATASSLKAQRSSMLPPPRQTISASQRPLRLAASIAAAIWGRHHHPGRGWGRG